MSGTSVIQRRLAQAPIGLAGLILVAVGCADTDPGPSGPTSSEQSPEPGASASSLAPTTQPVPTDGGNGGIVWPALPDGPEVPQTQEIQVYKVLAAADAGRCNALFTTEGVQGEGFVVSLVPPTELSFVTGDRTRHLYEAAAHLCAGDETAARGAFAAALSLGAWEAQAEDPETKLVVCIVWDAVAGLLDPSAGACTLQLATPDDGEADETAADATESATDDGAAATEGPTDGGADATDSETDAP